MYVHCLGGGDGGGDALWLFISAVLTLLFVCKSTHIRDAEPFFFLLGLIFSPTSNLFIATAFIHLK